jgi:CDP-diglyceride synthetase
MEAILILFIFIGLTATHLLAYRVGRAIGERRHRAAAESTDSVL